MNTREEEVLELLRLRRSSSSAPPRVVQPPPPTGAPDAATGATQSTAAVSTQEMSSETRKRLYETLALSHRIASVARPLLASPNAVPVSTFHELYNLASLMVANVRDIGPPSAHITLITPVAADKTQPPHTTNDPATNKLPAFVSTNGGPPTLPPLASLQPATSFLPSNRPLTSVVENDQKESMPKGRGKKRRKKAVGLPNQACAMCARTDTPEWRKGPDGTHCLCNACGLRWKRQLNKAQTVE
eukprot:TRINITY_DN935_c0_g1_i1.p1 TRINITY_DN935_c0_g1~~TRINITY_DN935_c0_g1_i1.p1  ORF type:complete len:244 (+),score=33.76 TRINITY_DN935_c0_g1_i1:146-877(+)